MLHACVSSSRGHAAPPLALGTVTLRVRVWVPPPHSVEQDPQSVHEPTWQSTGHACVLQFWDSVNVGHAAPPFKGCVVTVRVRDCVPPPQSLSHVLHEDHDDTLQSTGQPCVLHADVSVRAGHDVPPLAGWTVMMRVLVWMPPPHVLVHDEYGVHAPTSQLIGHGWVLHSELSARAGHGAPP